MPVPAARAGRDRTRHGGTRLTGHDRTGRGFLRYHANFIINNVTHKLKLDLNFATSDIFTRINLDKALLVKPEKSCSIATKLKFDFCSKVILG